MCKCVLKYFNHLSFIILDDNQQTKGEFHMIKYARNGKTIPHERALKMDSNNLVWLLIYRWFCQTQFVFFYLKQTQRSCVNLKIIQKLKRSEVLFFNYSISCGRRLDKRPITDGKAAVRVWIFFLILPDGTKKYLLSIIR